MPPKRISLPLLTIIPLTVAITLGTASDRILYADDPRVESKPTVELTIDFGDGAEKRYRTIPWKEGMTAGDSLDYAEKHPHGIELETRGRGPTAILLRIDDVRNSSASGKNWIFRVDGKLADRSFGVFSLDAGASVLWRFEEYP